MAYTNKDIAKLAKRANKRLQNLEKHGYKSPAYQSAQARLEMLGTRKNKNTGRRFKESGSFRNKNEAAQYEAALKQFLGQSTSTLKGYKEYRENIIESANERYNFDELGITEDEYLAIWEALPDRESDRIYGSDEVVEIVSAAVRFQKEQREENQMNIKEIVDVIQNSKNFKSALKSLGLTAKDLNDNNLGRL